MAPNSRRSATRGRWRRRVVALFAATAAAALLVGCAGGGGEESPGAGSSVDSVVIAETAPLASWVAYAVNDRPGYSTWGNIYEPLVTYDYAAGEFVGVLAESWEVDGLEWTFHLREGVTFHDGTPFTADDVVGSFDRIRNLEDSTQGYLIEEFDTMEAVDDHTVVIATKRPWAGFLNNIVVLYMTSNAWFEQHGEDDAWRQPNGTGPYSFVEWQEGADFIIERYSDYWGEQPAVEQASIRTIVESAARVAALERGEVDLIRDAPIDSIAALESNDRVGLVRADGIRFAFFPLNPAIPPLDNRDVREAINLAIDRESIIKNILKDQMQPMNGPLPSFIMGADPDWPPFEYDPDKARDLLEQAGFGDGITLDLTTTNGRTPKDYEMAQAIAGMLGEVGITVNVLTPEPAVLSQDQQAGKLQFFQTSRGGYVDAGEFLVQYFRTGVTNRIIYSNPEIDALLDEQFSELDPAKRTELLQEAGTMVRDEHLAIYLGVFDDIYGVNKAIEFTPNPDQNMLAKDIRPAA